MTLLPTLRAAAVVALVGLIGVGSTACDRSSSAAVGRLEVDGTAEVATVEGDLKDVSGARTLKSGEQVTMVDGTAVLSLGEGRQLELRKGTVVRLALRTGQAGREEPQGELLTGDVLVIAPEDAATVVAGDSIIQVNGSAKVSRGLAVVTGVYQGAAGVETAGRAVSVPALRQVTVPAPGLPSRAMPLAFSPSDSWDQRFLGDAADLGNRLVATSRGFSDQLPPGEGRTVGFFQQLLPALAGQPEFTAALLDPSRPPGETLVGAAITLEGRKSTFSDRWATVFTFHDDGAPWGIVALDQGVSRGPLLGAVDAAVSRLLGAGTLAAPGSPSVASGAAGGTASTARTPATGSSSTPAGSTAGTPGSTSGGTGTAMGTTATGGTTPTGSVSAGLPSGVEVGPSPDELGRGPLALGVPLVDDTVNALVETLSGLLKAVGRQ